ncbi:prolyl oligopeptidase family serine peptidase [Alkalihalobacillus sp. 1P02AB]|uniref:prolyl oligopeptidase family serine peptidase n=1 Tax=Alkalihalobacillus sp. 1P02AB TaxID=3132260 RepID=UPI0039A4708B
MTRKNVFLKLVASSLLICLFTGCASENEVSSNEGESEVILGKLSSENVTLITKVLPLGEVVYAMAADFGDEIDGATLDPSSFEVEVAVGDDIETRTITNVYTNDQMEISDVGRAGRYVIIEMDPIEASASTLSFNIDSFLNTRNELNYLLVQKETILTVNGTVFEASEEKIEHTNEVTPIVDEFGKFTYQDDFGNEMPYRLFEPQTESDKKYPLVLFLHGSGERGSDNSLQLLGNESALVWATPEQQAKNPAYVLSPQAPTQEILTTYWADEPNYSMVEELLVETIEKYPIDTNRIYVTGVSNGGVGTWHIAIQNPELFAAIVPVCGYPDVANNEVLEPYVPLEDASLLEGIKDLPIWVFHAADDELVDVNYSRDAVAAIESLGGSSIRYTEYPEGEVEPNGHHAWIPAYQNQEMIDWVFEQSK